jgi:hypothetical protein
VVCSGGAIAICAKIESSVFSGNTSLDFKNHPLVGNGTVAGNSKVNPVRVVIDFLDELGNGDNGNSLSLAQFQELRESQKFTVIADDFADDSHWLEPCHLHELNGSLSVTRAFSDAPGGGFQGEYVTGSNQGGGG